MESIYVKEEVVDGNKLRTHPSTDTGDEEDLTVDENVKGEIDIKEELEVDLRRDTFDGSVTMDCADVKRDFDSTEAKTRVSKQVENKDLPLVAHPVQDINICNKYSVAMNASIKLNGGNVFKITKENIQMIYFNALSVILRLI